MKIVKIFMLLFFIPLFINATNWHIGTDLGYRMGLSFQAKGTVNNFAQDFPLQVRLAVSYNSTDPGKAWAARRIFINNNTGGTPEKNGWFWDTELLILAKLHFKIIVYEIPIKWTEYRGRGKSKVKIFNTIRDYITKLIWLRKKLKKLNNDRIRG